MLRFVIIQLLMVILLIPALCRPGLAHKVRIFAWQDGGNIMTESKFSGGRPAQNVTVTVTDSETGQDLLSGKTDTEGLFSFPLPATGTKELQIIVDGGDGHKNSWTYPLEASSPSPSSVGSDAPPEETGASAQHTTQPDTRKDRENKAKNLQAITASELTSIIEVAMDKKLAPIKRTLAEQSEREPTLQDILGGIGYILGLAGIAAYMQSLKNKKGGKA